MTTRFPFLALLLAFLINLFPGAALHAQAGATSPVRLRVCSSLNGAALLPEALQVFADPLQPPVLSLDAGSLGPDNTFILQLPAGRYTLLAAAAGFESMTTRLVIDENPPEQFTLFLDPVEISGPLSYPGLENLRRDDATLIVGYVVDEQTRRPLAGVRVEGLSGSGSATTDQNGFFAFTLPLSGEDGSFLVQREGYLEQLHQNVETWPRGDWQYRIRLQAGNGRQVIDESKALRRNQSGQVQPQPEPPAGEQPLTDPVLLRRTIRVGRNCSGPTSCTSVEVYSLQTYCKFVLPAEWFSCWGSLPQGMNSLQAGAVAIRSFAAWHVYNPLTSTYDICDNTFCQFFGSSQTSNANLAVDLTDRYVLVNSSNLIRRSEYSAENNNAGCGDGYSGTGTTWPCIYDPVCSGQITFGHGRGLCQWGSARWATGLRLLTSAACDPGAQPHGFGTKTWQQILAHYYPDYQLTQGSTAIITGLQAIPDQVIPGQTLTLQYSVTAAPAVTLMLGASVRPGAGAWIDDPANDRKLTVNSGNSTVTRSFHLPSNAPFGEYDALTALWYDLDNNNQINSADFLLDVQQFNQAFTVGTTGIERSSEDLPGRFALAQNFPNPFNPATTIEFSLPQSARVELKVFDAAGREIASLLSGQVAAGNYRLNWDGGGLASGVYFYRMVARGGDGRTFQQTRRLILAR